MKNFIVIPTYNERENITKLVPQIFSLVPEVYILVVDDNSPDGTAEVVARMQKDFAHLMLLKRPGKAGLGRAYVHAFKELLKNPEVSNIVTMDADFSHKPTYLPTLLHGLKGVDVVIGSRYTPSGATEGWELWRRVLSALGNFYCRVITRMPVKDCTGGFNAINARILRKVNLDTLDRSGYAFIMELKFALYKAGAHFAEVPIVFTNRREGESKISNHIIGEGIMAPWKMILKK